MFIRIKNIIINTSAIASVDLNDAGGVKIRLMAAEGSFGYGDTGCGAVEPVAYLFAGLEADELKRWFTKSLPSGQ